MSLSEISYLIVLSVGLYTMNKAPCSSLDESVGHIHKITLTSLKIKLNFLAEDSCTLSAASIRNLMKNRDFHETTLKSISN